MIPFLFNGEKEESFNSGEQDPQTTKIENPDIKQINTMLMDLIDKMKGNQTFQIRR